MKNVLVTGGLGYIGSHTVLRLVEDGINPIIIDNLNNTSLKVLTEIEKIAGHKITFYQMDIRNKTNLSNVFSKHNIHSVIHFAALKAVSESITIPLAYYDNNITGTLNLLTIMADFNVNKIVFSSSATVYCQSNCVPLKETYKLAVTNPYGRTKLIIEEILADLCISNPDFSAVSLRYFNPLGAHISGNIGDNPAGIPNNLAPYITQVAIGKLEQLNIFGSDYPTPDGTCIRDYIHVEDLALGHIKALQLLNTGFNAINLGSGNGYSVLEILNSFKEVVGHRIPFKIVERRQGDIAVSIADITKAKEVLNWTPLKTLNDMCEDSWRWQERHPKGL